MVWILNDGTGVAAGKHPSAGFKLDHPLSTFLVHDTVTTLATTNRFSRFYFILGAAVCADVFHILALLYVGSTSRIRILLTWLVHRGEQRKSQSAKGVTIV